MSNMRHGFYSRKAHQLARESFSVDRPGRCQNVQVGPEGLVVTSWFMSREGGEQAYHWDDKQYVGEFDMGTFTPTYADRVSIR